MPAYLVRLIESRDLVGFLFADEPDDLLMIIDEITDAADCEYVELPDGGIMWGSPAIQVPIEIDKDSENPDDDIPGAAFSESWWSEIHGYTEQRWTKFVPENPLKPRPPAPRRPMGPGRVLRFRKRGG
jgi:hypothetical protein